MVCVCVCVLTGLQDQVMWLNYEVMGFQASDSDWSIPRLCSLLLCTLPCPSCYYNLNHRCHTSSSAHLGVPVSDPSSTSATQGHFTTWASLTACQLPNAPSLSPLVPTTWHSPTILFLLASRDSVRVAWSCFSESSWHHQAFLLSPPSSYPVSLAQTSNRGYSTTPLATVACRLPMYVLVYCITAASRTSSVPGVSHVQSLNHLACFPVICLKNSVCIPSAFLSISAKRTHVSNPIIYSDESFVFFYHFYEFNCWQLSGIRVSFKYNHLQPPDAAAFCYVDVIISWVRYFSIKKYLLSFRDLTWRHT